MSKGPLTRTPDEHFEKLVTVTEEAIDLMYTGFSVGLYGVGSKIMVIDTVRQLVLANCAPGDCVIRIRGYDQTFPVIRTIAAGLASKAAAAANNETARQVVRQNKNIRNQNDVIKAFDKIPKSRHVFILIDSIDAIPMRGYQDFFSRLAAYPNVHMCASVDHCKVGLLWNPPQLRRFSWCWLEASTYRDYTKEISDLVSFWENLIDGKIESNSKSLSVVMQSLTGNHQQLIQILARMQLDAGIDVGCEYTQIRSNDLLKKLTRSMVATNAGKMKQLMNELLDHRIVLFSKEKETGNEMYWLPYDRDMLEKISKNELVN
jgi:hypothetical protein